MYQKEAREEYSEALKKGQKEYRAAVAAGISPHPAVLDEILPEGTTETVVSETCSEASL